MGGINQTAIRFVPGRSGNPDGKKKGTRNRATLLAEVLQDGEGEAAARIVIDKALAGDAVAARFLLDRLTPRPRGRPIALDLPAGASADDVLAASNATVAATASGEITPDEALTVTRVLDGRLRALKAARREHAKLKPSPRGRGLGEGRRPAFAGAGITSSKSPHPFPLPRGEGVAVRHPVTGARNSPAHLLHSTCISTLPGFVPAARLGERAAAFS